MSAKKYDDISIYYDKSRNRYSAKVTVKKGNPRKTVYGKTEEEVVLKARKLLYGTKDEDFIVSKGIPLAELLKFNLERRDKAGKVGDSQYNRTKYIIKMIEKSEIGSKNIIDLTENDYQNFFNNIALKYSDSTIDKCYSEINQALKYAQRKKIIGINVLEDIIKSKSKTPPKEVKTLTTKQQKILSDYLCNLSIEDYQYKNVFLIQMYMGLRIGEVLALKESDIDLQNKKIHIKRTLTENRTRSKVMGDKTKTYSGDRVIPIPDIVYPYVKEQVEISKSNTDNLLFVHNDKLVRHTSMNDQLKRKLINLGIYENGFSTHSLRHTYATRCIESGMQAIVLSKLMGHKDIRVTLNKYVKIFNEYQTKIANQVEHYYNDIELTSNKTPQTYNNNNYENSENIGAKIIQFPRKAVNDFFNR